MQDDFEDREPVDVSGFLTPDTPAEDDLEFYDDTERDVGFQTLMGIVHIYSAYMCWSPATPL
jgi:hypothetical protein